MSDEYQCRFCGGQDGRPTVAGIKDWEYDVAGEYAFIECRDCGGVQLHPFPELEDLIEAYNVDYHGYAELADMGRLFHALYAAKESFFQKQLQRLIPRGARVLDVGCGNGKFLSRVRDIGAGYVEGIDFNERAIALLEDKGICGYRGTFEQYVKEDGYFDLIAMNNYLEHTLDPDAEVRKARRLLKDGGYLIGEIPGFDSFERRIFGKYWGGNHVPRHTFQFHQSFLKSLLDRANFRRVRITHELNTGHWALSVQNLLHRHSTNGQKTRGLKHGRAWYYFPLLVAFIPVNVFCVLARRAGVIKFFAEA
jgi:SAM-dependent methyltransferase